MSWVRADGYFMLLSFDTSLMVNLVVINEQPLSLAMISIQIVRHISSSTDPGRNVALFFAIAAMYSVSAMSFVARASHCARLS